MLAEPKKSSTNTEIPSLHRQTGLFSLLVRQDNISNVAIVGFKNFVNLTKNSIAKTRRAAQHEKNKERARTSFQN